VSAKKVCNILTIGGGTGGDLLGLLVAIEKYYSCIETLNIWTIDGNSDSLSILSRIVETFQNQSNKRIVLKTLKVVFTDIATFDLAICNIDGVQFDFILSFKMVGEIISAGKGACDNSYYDFVKKFVPLLSECGLCVLLDVTTKTEHTPFNPILMNRQTNQALRELNDYKTLLPLSCNLYEERCRVDCFCQQIFTVTHQQRTNDRSKVAYRIMVRKTFGDKIINPNTNAGYIIQGMQQKSDNQICPYTINGLNTVDAYKLKS
jgi:hypothetical protein